MKNPPNQGGLGSHPDKTSTYNKKIKSATYTTAYSQKNHRLARKTGFKPQNQVLLRVNEPDVGRIKMKSDQYVRTIKSICQFK